MALGGVATGSIKAHEAAIPIKTDSMIGDSPNASAMAANTGTNSAALAVLLANSVSITTKKITAKVNNAIWVLPKISVTQ